jgi:hypothetical protein
MHIKCLPFVWLVVLSMLEMCLMFSVCIGFYSCVGTVKGEAGEGGLSKNKKN